MLIKLTCWIGILSPLSTTHTHGYFPWMPCPHLLIPPIVLTFPIHWQPGVQPYCISWLQQGYWCRQYICKNAKRCHLVYYLLIKFIHQNWCRTGAFPENWKCARVLVFIDISKAFDTVPYLQKIIVYWRWSLYQKVHSHLFIGREQYVALNGAKSLVLLLVSDSVVLVSYSCNHILF